LPKTNYKYEKRQKDIAKQKKREEKLKRRQQKKQQGDGAPVENGAGTEDQVQGEAGSGDAAE
jgi:hypothetical protein